MNSLPFPTYDCRKLIPEMLDHLSLRYPGISTRLVTLLIESAIQYESNMRSDGPYEHPLISDDDAEALESAFISLRDTVKFSEPRKALEAARETIGRWCPFCGISQAYTYDHFVPKKGGQPSYPEHAFYLWNLVPMCSRCNGRKATMSADEPRALPFPHVYFDAYQIEKTVLKAKVVTTSGYPFLDFYLDFESGVDQTWAELVHKMCRRLRLFDEWSYQGQSEMSNVAMEYDPEQYVDGLAGIEGHLRVRAQSTRRSFGRNSLRAVVYDTLASSGEFWEGPHLLARGERP